MTPVLLLLLLFSQPGARGPNPHISEARSAPRPADACGDPVSYQVLLDRRGISPGEIDGAGGPNLERAVRTFQESAGLRVTGKADCATWQALTANGSPEVLVDYEITADDVKGPFLESAVPGDLVAQAKLETLAYSSPIEALAERFHASPRLLARLNPNHPLTPGSRLRVPAVEPFDPTRRPQPEAADKGLSIQVSRSRSQLRATRADGSVAFVAPVSSGSEHDPLPIGAWKVTGVAWLPPFQYNPELFWDAEPGHSKATIKPGPNNPVGVVWIDIDVPHYGLHGTPAPNRVGHAQSHGCVRLTNWDAARLASLVRPGTAVVFVE